jgi:hypothetical protein
MPRSKSTTVRPDAFRYSPGDGHTYVWDRGAMVMVYRHRYDAGGQLQLDPVDQFSVWDPITRAPAILPTAEALAAAVTVWRGTTT